MVLATVYAFTAAVLHAGWNLRIGPPRGTARARRLRGRPRESSVLLAAVIGWRWLGERRGPVRGIASAVVVAGLMLLVATV